MLSDSLCTISWRARPRSFVSLMTLYESNFIRLGWLAPDLRRLSGSLTSEVAGEPALELSVVEQCRYTTALQMTYLFGEGERAEREPGLEIRVYHDARLAEACGTGAAPSAPAAAESRAGVRRTTASAGPATCCSTSGSSTASGNGHRFAVPAA